MTGRKTLREVREQLAAARAGIRSTTDSAAQETLEALERLADELESTKESLSEGETSSRDATDRTKRRLDS